MRQNVNSMSEITLGELFPAWELQVKEFCMSFLYRNIFGPVLGSSPAQNPPVLPSMQPGFGGDNINCYSSDTESSNTFFREISAHVDWRLYLFFSTHCLCFYLAVPSTNPFVAAAVAPEMATNPFQTNGRTPAAGVCVCAFNDLFFPLCYVDVTQLHCQVVCDLPEYLEFTPPCVCVYAHCVCLVASFGTGSMSMPAGFGNASSYCLPTSFSGNFQQQFPGQAPIPYSQPGAYHPQSNG